MNIKLQNIYFNYGSNKVFEGLNLTIKSGEMLAILGHNGSGKSTIAKLILGLLDFKKGNIYFNEERLTTENVDELRKNVAIIFQNPDNQFVGVTVKDDIAFGLENHQVPRKEMLEKIDKYIKLVNMEKYLNSNPEDLSGGQKQRVAIAGALAMETGVIIFDEATSMLDPKGTKEINQTIKELKNTANKTIITITHNIEEAIFADRVVVLNEGKIVLDGTPKEVLQQKDILIQSGLTLIDSIEIINTLKDDQKYQKIIDKLWEITFDIQE